MSLSQQDKEFLKQRFTFSGRIFFPNLTKPEPDRKGVPKYGTVVAWKFHENAQELQRLGAFIAEFKNRFFPTVPLQFFVNPLKKYGEYQRQDGRPLQEFFKDCYWLNASSGKDMPPVLVDKFKQPVMSEAEVYSGRNAVVSVSFYIIDKEKKGLGVNVNGVMLMDGGNKEGGATFNVEEVFGSFAQDMGMGGAGNMFGNQAPPQQGYNPAPQQGYNPAPQQPAQQGYNPAPQQGYNPMGNGNAGPAYPQQGYNPGGQAGHAQNAQTFPSNGGQQQYNQQPNNGGQQWPPQNNNGSFV